MKDSQGLHAVAGTDSEAPNLVSRGDDETHRVQMRPSQSHTPPHTLYGQRERWWLLAVLFLVATSNFIDRSIISVVLEPIKAEFKVSDTQLGLLSGLAFALFYASLGIPVARWADRGNRRRIVTLALVTWSVATALCGMAQTFWQLALARVGVGAAEAGALPPSQSLIADYFSPERRASALAVFTSAATAGALIGFAGGAYLVSEYGWRAAFLVVGLPGLALAVLTLFALKEPREHLGFPDPASMPSIIEPLKALLAKRSYVGVVIGLTLYWFMLYGAAVFFPSYMLRSLGVSLKQVGTDYAAIAAIATLIGTLGGGRLADRLGSRDVRWFAWLPALAIALAVPLYVLAFSLNSYRSFLALVFVAVTFLSAGLPSSYTAMHAVCGSAQRALAVSVLLFFMNFVGAGLGPLAAGVLSDLYAPYFGAEALRAALITAFLFLLPSAFALYLAGRSMPQDVEP